MQKRCRKLGWNVTARRGTGKLSANESHAMKGHLTWQLHCKSVSTLFRVIDEEFTSLCAGITLLVFPTIWAGLDHLMASHTQERERVSGVCFLFLEEARESHLRQRERGRSGARQDVTLSPFFSLFFFTELCELRLKGRALFCKYAQCHS